MGPVGLTTCLLSDDSFCLTILRHSDFSCLCLIVVEVFQWRVVERCIW
jgi:hypothetical protein